MVHSVLEAPVGVESEALLHQLEQVHALVYILVHDLYAVDVALLVFKLGPIRLTLERFEVEKGMDLDFDAEGVLAESGHGGLRPHQFGGGVSFGLLADEG